MKLEPPDKQPLKGCVFGIFLVLIFMFGLLSKLISDLESFNSPATIPPEFTATPGMLLTSVPEEVSQLGVERYLGVSLPSELTDFRAVRICFIDCDLGVKFSGSPKEIREFTLSFDNMKIREGTNPFGTRYSSTIDFIEWWNPYEAERFTGSILSSNPQILIDQTNRELYTIYLYLLLG